MSLRKLVTIRKIAEITPIEGADLIELARVDGWRSVVKKNQFKVGDYVVYFEIDSFLPIEPRYEFLRQRYSKKMIVEGQGEVEGIRLRTITLKGKISQGLILPLSDFPEFDLSTDIGIDLSGKINVLKYEQPIPACIAGEIRRAIPSCIKKTDQLRIQNALDFFEIHKDTEFEETEKEDGTSTSYYLYDGEFCVAGHNWELRKTDKNVMWRLTEKYGLEEALRYVGKEVALQGETVGEGIQKNPMLIKNNAFHVFDIFDIKEGRYMIPDERYEYLDRVNNFLDPDKRIIHVPIINKAIKIFQICRNIDEILDRAHGDTIYTKGRKREGLVFKCTKLINGINVTFKAVDDRQLAKEKD